MSADLFTIHSFFLGSMALAELTSDMYSMETIDAMITILRTM